jgi:hypothetical protein
MNPHPSRWAELPGPAGAGLRGDVLEMPGGEPQFLQLLRRGHPLPIPAAYTIVLIQEGLALPDAAFWRTLLAQMRLCSTEEESATDPITASGMQSRLET